MSATAAVVTLAVAESLAGVASPAAETVAVALRVVPPATELGTFETIVNVACVAEFIVDDREQVIVPFVPATGVVQVHPAGAAIETNVVGAGRGTLTDASLAALGPLFVTTKVHVKSVPAFTGSGVPAMVTLKSVEGATRTSTSKLLSFALGSGVALLMVAVVLNVPEAVGKVDAVIVTVAVPGGSAGVVQLTVPPLPGAGAVHNHPAGALSD
ncbi:MAG TPA: hypothetical protein VGQ21_16220 [Thermoanaerobaculia bacterium]|jgi:hypothetical protein|nr:hypothetical protein [Thermoanaerobaculia bacterium]